MHNCITVTILKPGHLDSLVLLLISTEMCKISIFDSLGKSGGTKIYYSVFLYNFCFTFMFLEGRDYVENPDLLSQCHWLCCFISGHERWIDFLLLYPILPLHLRAASTSRCRFLSTQHWLQTHLKKLSHTWDDTKINYLLGKLC